MNSTIKRAINTLNTLEKNGIEYCILRNYEFLTGGEIGSDIDLAVRDCDRIKTDKILCGNGLEETTGKRRRSTYKYVVNDCSSFKLDISFGGTEYNGLPLIDINQLLANRRKKNTCWIPSKNDLFVHLTFHAAIKKRRFRQSYRQILKDLESSIEIDTVTDHAQQICGTLGVKAIQLAIDRKYSEIVDMKWKLVAANCTRHPSRIPEFIYTLSSRTTTRQSVHHLLRWYIGNQPIVVVTGPDGAGKSTLTQNIKRELEQRRYDVHLAELGLRNSQSKLLSVGRRIYNFISAKDTTGIITDYDKSLDSKLKKEGRRELGDRDGFHKAVFHYLDIVLRILALRHVDADVIISDRYIHDVGVYDSPLFLSQTFGWFERDPFYPFLLTADPDAFVDRSEYTPESLIELCDRYDELEFTRLDASKRPDEVRNALLDKLVYEHELDDHLNQK